MHSFSEQCLDMARSILGHNLDSIQPDGSVLPANGELSRPDEPGHVAFALGEYYRATGETSLLGRDLVDLAARCITAQVFTEPPTENGLAYASLGLLCFGPSKERNPVWERLVPETQQHQPLGNQLATLLLVGEFNVQLATFLHIHRSPQIRYFAPGDQWTPRGGVLQLEDILIH